MDEGTGKIKIEASWKQSFELLKAYIEECHHRFNNRHIAGFPNKHTRLLSRVKYTRKKINDDTLEDWKKEQFLEVANMRDMEGHCGGRRSSISLTNQAER